MHGGREEVIHSHLRAGRDARDLGDFPRMQRTLNFVSLLNQDLLNSKNLEFRN